MKILYFFFDKTIILKLYLSFTINFSLIIIIFISAKYLKSYMALLARLEFIKLN